MNNDGYWIPWDIHNCWSRASEEKKGKRSSLTKNTEDVLVIRSLVVNENYKVIYVLE